MLKKYNTLEVASADGMNEFDNMYCMRMRQRCKRILLYMVTALAVTIVTAGCYRVNAESKYARADELMKSGNYAEAAALYQKFSIYRDSAELARKAEELLAKEQTTVEQPTLPDLKYEEACNYMHSGNYPAACMLFSELGNYKDSASRADVCERQWRASCAHTISAGTRCSAGITPEYKVEFTTNDDFFGKLAIAEWTDIVSVSVCGKIVIGLHSDGSVETATERSPENYERRLHTESWHNIVDISAGDHYVVGLQRDGTLVVDSLFQPDGYGEADVLNWKNIVSIDTAWQCTAGLDKDGTVYLAGYHAEDLLSEIAATENSENINEKWSDIVAISIGGCTGGNVEYKFKTHIVGLTKDGRVVAVGNDDYDQCKVNEWAEIVRTNNDRIIAISAGDYHTVALTENGYVYTTQSETRYESSYRAIMEMRDIIEVSAGYGLTLGLRSDGTVASAGNYKEGQANVENWNLLIRNGAMS